MRASRGLRIGLMIGAVLSPAPVLAQGVTISHRGVGCIVAGHFPLLDAGLDPADSVARARVLFRAEGTPNWYFVEMKPGGRSFWGALP